MFRTSQQIWSIATFQESQTVPESTKESLQCIRDKKNIPIDDDGHVNALYKQKK